MKNSHELYEMTNSHEYDFVFYSEHVFYEEEM